MTKQNWLILVVEDDPDGQEVVETILNHMKIPHDLVGNAEDAEELIFNSDARYDAIIIDLALPGKDGWELLTQIRGSDSGAHIPCVAVTAFHTSKLREEALTAGFNAYFSKPIDATAFARGLESVLA